MDDVYYVPPRFDRADSPADEVYYDKNWTRETELLSMWRLYKAKIAGKWIPGEYEHNKMYAYEAWHYLRYESETLPDVELSQFYYKVREWSRRHMMFSDLIANDDVWYDEENNMVYASNATWNRLAKMNRYYQYYWPEGEKNWAFMKQLYDDPPKRADTTKSG